MKRLKNKIAVITGASSGIGADISELFASEGADVVVNYLSSKEKAEIVVKNIESLGRQALAIQADMSDKKAIDQLVKEVIEKFGKIDIWINNAGADILTGDYANANTHEKLEKLTETDLKGTINACWSVAEVMHKQQNGVIVNMGWDLSIHGFKGVNPQIFASTKSGVLGFTRSFAKTAGPSIRVNMVAPGWVKTTFAEKHMEKSFYQERLAEIPLGRFGTPRDIAKTVLFLASDESSYMAGESINVNGGLI